MRRLHRWLGVLLSLVLLVVAVSGLALRHPDLAARVLREPSHPGAWADRTTALAADPLMPGRFLVGTARGVFESRDGGRTWRDVLLHAPATHVVSVAFDPSSPLRVLIAMAEGGVFVSEDGGEVWDDAGVPAEAIEARLQAVTFAAGGAIVVRSGAGLFRGVSGGTWTRINAATSGGASASRMNLVAAIHGGQLHAAMGVAVDLSAIGLLVLIGTGWVLALQRQSRRMRSQRRHAR